MALRTVILTQQGERAPLAKSLKIIIKLTWKNAVNLNLHAFCQERESDLFGHIYANNRGKLYHPPCIQFDAEDNNEAMISINTLTHVESILIAVSVKQKFGFFSAEKKFAEYGGKLTLEISQRNPIEVFLDTEEVGKWCIMVKIDNLDPSNPQVIKLNKVQKSEPKLKDF